MILEEKVKRLQTSFPIDSASTQKIYRAKKFLRTLGRISVAACIALSGLSGGCSSDEKIPRFYSGEYPPLPKKDTVEISAVDTYSPPRQDYVDLAPDEPKIWGYVEPKPSPDIYMDATKAASDSTEIESSGIDALVPEEEALPDCKTITLPMVIPDCTVDGEELSKWGDIFNNYHDCCPDQKVVLSKACDSDYSQDAGIEFQVTQAFDTVLVGEEDCLANSWWITYYGPGTFYFMGVCGNYTILTKVCETIRFFATPKYDDGNTIERIFKNGEEIAMIGPEPILGPEPFIDKKSLLLALEGTPENPIYIAIKVTKL